MKKNGFTLIELLGTILLLSLLLVFIGSNVISSIEESKKAAANASAENLIDALENYYFESKMHGTFEPCSYNFSTNINTCEGFIFDGKKPSKGLISIDEEGIVSGRLDFGNYVAIISDGSIIVPEDSESNDEYIGTEYVFNYTGGEQTFTVPYNGYYKVELWGAQGGNANYSTQYYGGKGAYTSGNIRLDKDTKLYVYVGGMGVSHSGTSSDTVTTNGNGYNGGGQNGVFFENNSNGGGGGGATDIRTIGGLWNDFNSLKSRVMVAGGGGGADSHSSSPSWSGNGGAAGGLTGYDADKAGSCYYYGTGATQTSSGIGNSCGSSYSGQLDASSGFGYADSIHAGGGGGYYGGGASQHTSAGGGSSFISGYSGCNAISESSTSSNITHLNQSNHYSGKVFTSGVMIDGKGCTWFTGSATNCGSNQPQPDGTMAEGHEGNGYAKITYLGTNSDVSNGLRNRVLSLYSNEISNASNYFIIYRNNFSSADLVLYDSNYNFQLRVVEPENSSTDIPYFKLYVIGDYVIKENITMNASTTNTHNGNSRFYRGLQFWYSGQDYNIEMFGYPSNINNYQAYKKNFGKITTTQTYQNVNLDDILTLPSSYNDVSCRDYMVLTYNSNAQFYCLTGDSTFTYNPGSKNFTFNYNSGHMYRFKYDSNWNIVFDADVSWSTLNNTSYKNNDILDIILLSTFDIKDSNNNVVFPANTTVSKLTTNYVE